MAPSSRARISANILLDVAVLRSLSIKVLLVHGAAAQIETWPANKISSLQPGRQRHHGRATLKLALTAANRLTHEILEGLSANDLRAASLATRLIAHPMGIIHGQDHLFTGKIERVDTEMLQSLLAQGIVPVVPPLGFDGDGKTYRVNSDSVAVGIGQGAQRRQAHLHHHHGRADLPGQIDPADFGGRSGRLLAHNKSSFAPEVFPRRTTPRPPAQAGVPRVHIINGAWMKRCWRRFFPTKASARSSMPTNTSKSGAPEEGHSRHMLLTKNSVANEELVKRTRATWRRAQRFLYF
jgi:amino-acid N-acetyltransferase